MEAIGIVALVIVIYLLAKGKLGTESASGATRTSPVSADGQDSIQPVTVTTGTGTLSDSLIVATGFIRQHPITGGAPGSGQHTVKR